MKRSNCERTTTLCQFQSGGSAADLDCPPALRDRGHDGIERLGGPVDKQNSKAQLAQIATLPRGMDPRNDKPVML
ncbi:MAG TPA: hypothetical protein VEE84_07060 [Burkholderiaceae bacterium]|nr:hypothetical protein [Burkholderiaceae bacterium]